MHTHKFGIEVPKTVKCVLEGKMAIPSGRMPSLKRRRMYRWNSRIWMMGSKSHQVTNMYCHTIFDVKLDGHFTRKAWFVAGGHLTETPAVLTYANVVSHDTA